MLNIALDVLDIIENSGFKAYIVGGFPRDMVLKRNSADVDICTNARPKDLTQIFGDTKITNIDYGCVIVKHSNILFAITTYRKDKEYKNHRNPSGVKYVNNLLDDLKRRDFIINTMCIDSSGNIIDLLDAETDIKNKVIRCVGNAKKKIKEDSLRILRAIRFATVLDFELDNDLVNAIIKYRKELKSLSYSRKKEELEKIFTSSNKKDGIDLIRKLKLEEVLDLNFDNIVLTDSSIGIWAQLNVNNYPFTKSEKDVINKVNELKDLNILDPEVIYKYGLYVISVVGEIRGIDKKTILEEYNKLQIYDRTEISLQPLEICDYLNIKPSFKIKEIIADIEKMIVCNNLKNDKEEIKKYLDKYKEN